jgi:hypothetical protein
MTTPRRLQLASATLVLFAAAAHVWGDSAASKRTAPNSLAAAIRTPDVNAEEIGSRFAQQTVVTYQPANGDEYFALQLKAILPPSQPRPRDVLVLIDTTASQAGRPLANARLVLDELAKAAKSDDRLDVWTVNTPDTTRSLTGGFKSVRSPKIAETSDYLTKKEYAAGAADLKNAIKKSLRDFGNRSDRQQVVLFLGDGESCLNPLTASDRSALAAEMTSREIAFFAVPLGTRLDAANLHGLASGTGGAVVRLLGEESPEKFIPKLTASFDAPIFYPSKTTFSAEVAEALPTKLPPLRGDAPALVAGLLKGSAKTIAVTAEGTLAGKRHTLTVSEAVPAPDASNYFLARLIGQWQASDRSAPALIRADRSLALTYEQVRLARDEVLTQAHWALSQNQLEAAAKLFDAALKFDPKDAEPTTGLRLVARLKDGKITRDQLREQLSDPKQMALRIGKGDGATVRLTQDQMAKLVGQDPPPQVPPPPAADALPPPTPSPAAPPSGDLLEQERRRRLVQEQQVTQVVDDVIARARREVNVDPDVAYDLLKRQLSSVRENTDLSERVRATLAARLEGSLRAAVAEGTRIRQAQQAELQRRLADEARRSAEAAVANEQDMIRERIRAFGALMNQARYEEAYKEALVLQQEQVSKGRPVPISATAAYGMSLNAANLREWEELRRIKEDRYLLTMLQVDRSHVPFPDEPPVAFPPAATWRELTAMRKDKYDAIGLEGPASRGAIKIRDMLNNPVSLDKAVEGSPLKDVLEYLSERYGLTFIVDTQAFEQAGVGGGRNVQETPVNLPRMPGVTLATVLRFLLAQVNGTYLIRRDYVEITTTDRSIAEKAVRAYPVADLVIPIPNAINQANLSQNLQVLGSSLSANGQAIFGAAGGGQALGFNGALGALGVLGPLGALGAAGGGVQGGGGIVGAIAGGGASGSGFSGALGFGGGNGQTNLGFGGGVLGFGGGQQGQFGNLGGQFGIQGGDTSSILIELIQDVIAPKEWQTRAARYLFNNVQVQSDEEQPLLNPDLLNSLGYYQPARALVVRATSRIQTRVGGLIGAPAPGPGGRGALDRPGADAVVIRPGDRSNRGATPATATANRDTNPRAGTPDVHEQVGGALNALRQARADRDPEKVWNDAFEKNLLKPRNVIAVADCLAVGDKFDEVVALLKADLRKGVIAEPCVFDALAMALKASGGSPEERERVLLSVIDLDPKNPRSYLQAAEAMHDLGKETQALAFCKRAAALEPNSADPYAQSLVYLTGAKTVDSDAVQWAAGNLIARDWSADRDLNRVKAQQALADAVSRLKAAGRAGEADRVQAALDKDKRRDLMIEAVWTDLADLDLEVTEPTGAVCGPRQPQSTGGGLWRGDQIMAPDRDEKYRETYTAAEAFSGAYEVRVKKVWGQPLGDKVTIRVTRRQGTPEQTQELHRLTFGSDGVAALNINLDNGRRTALASVPPPAPRKTERSARAAKGGPDRVYNLLRMMSDPVYSGMNKQAMMSGGAGESAPSAMSMLDAPPASYQAEVVHQNKLVNDDTTHTGAEIMGRAVFSPEQGTMTVHMAPVFQTASDRADVKLTAIPGGQ